MGQMARRRGSAGEWDLCGAAQDRQADLPVIGIVEKEVRRKPVGIGKEEGACFSWDEGNQALSL